MLGEFLYFPEPLIFKRCRTDHENGRHIAELIQQSSSSDSLDGFPESHLISDYAIAGAGSKFDSVSLIFIRHDSGTEYFLQPRIPFTENFIQLPASGSRRERSSQQFSGIFRDLKTFVTRAGSRYKVVEGCQIRGVGRKPVVLVKQSGSKSFQFPGRVAEIKRKARFPAVVHIEQGHFLRIPDRSYRAPSGRDTQFHCLEMLAGAQAGCFEIHTATPVERMPFPIIIQLITCPRSRIHDTVAPSKVLIAVS